MRYRVSRRFLGRVLKDKGHSQKFPRLWPRISETIKARHRNAMDELERTWNAPGPVRRLAADKGKWGEKMVLQQAWDFSRYTRRLWQNFTELRTDGSWTLSCFSQCLTRIRYRNIVSRLFQGFLPKMPIWMLYYLDILPIRSHVVPTYVKPPVQTFAQTISVPAFTFIFLVQHVLLCFWRLIA